MIPKKLHYIWLGNKQKPKNFQKVFLSWKKYAQGFEIIEWNESNCNEFILPPYFYRALSSKQYAFASDALRFHVLRTYGGIYIDVDQLLLKSIDTSELLSNNVFIAKYHEVDYYYGFGFIGCIPNTIFCKKMCEYFDTYIQKEYSIVNKIGSEIIQTLTTSQEEKITIFTQEYFYPLKKEDTTIHTYSQHLANRSWIPVWKKILHTIPYYFTIKTFLFRFIPTSLAKKITNIRY